MSESERVQRWRQRMRAEGKEPLTVWLTTAEKLRLEDQALTLRCSPSELIQRMLAQWHGEPQAVTDTVTDTEQLRALVQQELAQSHSVTDTVTDTVTATVQQMLPALVRTLLQEQQTGTVTATVTDTSTAPGKDPGRERAPACVTDTVTVTLTDTDTTPSGKRKPPVRQRPVTATVADTVTVTAPKHRGRKPVLREPILALLREHQAGLTAAQLKVYLDTEKHIGDTLSGMVKAELLVKAGSGQAVRYLLADAIEAPSRPG